MEKGEGIDELDLRPPSEAEKLPEIVDEQLENHTRAPATWLFDRLLEERNHYLICEQLRNKARTLGLLLSEEIDSNSVCGLSLNPEKATWASSYGASKIRLEHYSRSEHLEASEKEYVLIISSNMMIQKIAYSIGKSLYLIIGGVFWTNESTCHLSYGTFTAEENGISNDLPGPFQFAEYISEHFEGLPERKSILYLPESIKSSESRNFSLKFEYLIYQKVSPLESPYPAIQHLNLLDKTVFDIIKDRLELEKEFELQTIDEIIRQAICLVRFLQLWNEMNRDEALTNFDLMEIHDLLRDMEGGNVEKLEELLLKASEFIYRNYEGHKHVVHPFLPILMDQDMTIRNAFLHEVTNYCYHGARHRLESNLCERMYGKLLAFVEINSSLGCPYLLNVSSVDDYKEVASFKVIAKFHTSGGFMTYGIKDELVRGKYVLKRAHYGDESYVKITNVPIPDPQSLRITADNQLVIYHHVQNDEVRFARMKPSASYEFTA